MSDRALRPAAVIGAVALLCACGGGGGQVVVEGNDHDAGSNERPQQPAHNVSAQVEFERAASLWSTPTGAPDYDEVEDLLESAVDEDPSFAQAWFNLGVVREAKGDRDGALEAYRQSNAADPEYVDGLANIAAIQLDSGRTAEARQLLEQVVAVDQFHPGANLNLARMARVDARRGGAVDQSRADEAINRIRLSLAGDAMNVDAYETLAAVYYDLQRYQLARLVCVNAINLGLQSAELYNRLGLILLAQDDVTGAYAQFREAVSLDPTLTEASMNLGAIALNYRDYGGAREAFDRVLAHEPENIDAMISRAVALRGLEDLVGAEQGYQAVLAIDPDNLPAIYNLGVLYQEYHQDYRGAMEWFRRYVRADINGTSAEIDDVEQRIEVLDELIELLGDSAGGPGAVAEPPPGEMAPLDAAPVEDEPTGPEADPGLGPTEDSPNEP